MLLGHNDIYSNLCLIVFNLTAFQPSWLLQAAVILELLDRTVSLVFRADFTIVVLLIMINNHAFTWHIYLIHMC